MQVSFNPYITNQQQVKQPTHKAVIQKYVDVAKKDIKKYNQLDGEILRKLMIDVLIFKEYSIQDGIDTLKKIKDFAPNVQKLIEHYLDTLYKGS